MKPTVGWGLSGPSFVDSPQGARLGEPLWGPGELLRDLELRLGLPAVSVSEGARVSVYRARIGRLGSGAAFYARSFEVDSIGTAQVLLSWRDALVEAGWDGQDISDGGERLAALAAIEGAEESPVPMGFSDRLAQVQRALSSRSVPARLYEELRLVEERTLWSARWQRIFALLEASGTCLSSKEPCASLADPRSDLGVLQRLLRGERAEASEVGGDGSLLLLTGETLDEAAEMTASLVRSWGEGSLIIRYCYQAPLETALQRHGLAAQGHIGKSAWRPAMQILPLALELAFEPKDPYRALELLTLSVGPFRGRVGAQLARALAQQPGIGGQEWKKRKARLTAELREEGARRAQETNERDPDAFGEKWASERLRLVEAWFETEGAGAAGAKREDLIALARRVRDWLKGGLARGELDVYGPAYVQAKDFEEALAHDLRVTLSREEARQILDDVARVQHGETLSVEQAKRVPHVSHPSALLAPVRTLVVWGFASEMERRPEALPWSRHERAALDAAGVFFVDAERRLSREAETWRNAVLAASERVVFIVPSRVAARLAAPHSFWHEIVARLGSKESSAGKLVRSARDLLRAPEGSPVRVEALDPLALPSSREAWSLSQGALVLDGRDTSTSATALETFASCPLAWVLDDVGIERGMVARVPEGPILNGKLGHRLVEELFHEAAFEQEESVFVARVRCVLSELVRTEAATLLLPGAASERTQLENQLCASLRALHRYLRAAELRIVAVEEAVEVESALGKISARLDLRLADAQGKTAVLDLKWGAGSYTKKLEQGRAVQLAAYSRALRAKSQGDPPAAGYFSLGAGRILSVDPGMAPPRLLKGPSMEETWGRLERTLRVVKSALAQGRVLVGGTAGAPALLDALAVPGEEQEKFFSLEKKQVCDYCSYSGICGKAWEVFQ